PARAAALRTLAAPRPAGGGAGGRNRFSRVIRASLRACVRSRTSVQILRLQVAPRLRAGRQHLISSRFRTRLSLVYWKNPHIMDKVNIHEAKTNLSRLIDEVTGGAEIVIAKAGKPVARLVPI